MAVAHLGAVNVADGGLVEALSAGDGLAGQEVVAGAGLAVLQVDGPLVGGRQRAGAARALAVVVAGVVEADVAGDGRIPRGPAVAGAGHCGQEERGARGPGVSGGTGATAGGRSAAARAQPRVESPPPS